MLVNFWDHFVAETAGEKLLNLFTFGSLKAEEMEIPVLGLNAPIFGINPAGAIYKTFAAALPRLGIRQQYYDLEDTLAKVCPEFHHIDWPKLKTRLLIGASEIVNGMETVFDSDVNRGAQQASRGMQTGSLDYWRQQLPLTLSGIVASGTLPAFCEAERIEGCFYWDGLYSQNPPVREFFDGVDTEEVPDELWIVRINPQQWPEPPASNAEVMDRENELMGNLSLHKELDFILAVNEWRKSHGGKFADDYKHVVVRSIKMKKETADELRYSSKFNRTRQFMDQLSKEGREIARDWLDRWPDVGSYPEDAAYR
jgi:NTE family protein